MSHDLKILATSQPAAGMLCFRAMNLDAALLQMAELMKLRHDVHLDASTRLTPQPGLPITPAHVVANEKLTELDRSISRFSERCAANPSLHPHMQCWMIDIAGKSEAAPLGNTESASVQD